MKLKSFARFARQGFGLFRGSSCYLCLDMGSHSVKLLEVEGYETPTLVKAGVVRLPGSQAGSTVMQNPAAVLEGIRELKAGLSPKAKLVVTSVPGPSVIIKKFSIPKTRQMDAAIAEEASRMIPESLDRVQWDYEILENREEEGNQSEVILAAVKKEIIERTVDMIREVGWEPVVVDVDYFAIENLFEALHPNCHGVAALLHIGSRVTLMDIIKNGRSAFRGDISVGGREFSEAIMSEANMSFEEAEAVKNSSWQRGVTPPELISPMKSAMDGLVQEVKRSFSLYWALATEEQVSSIHLCGGGAMVPGLPEHMAQGLDLPVEILDPLRAMKVDKRVGSDFQSRGPELAVGAGLAFRRSRGQ